MAPIGNVFKTKEFVENQAYHEEETDFETRVMKSYDNPNTLEYAAAVNMANELRQRGLTSGKLISRGEKAAADLCGPEIIDVAVVVGALKKIEKMEKLKTKG